MAKRGEERLLTEWRDEGRPVNHIQSIEDIVVEPELVCLEERERSRDFSFMLYTIRITNYY